MSRDVRIALQKFGRALDTDAVPTFASVLLTDLTASRLTASDSTKTLESVTDLTAWIAGTANEIDISDDGDGTVTIGIVNPLIVDKGGTGTNTLTDHGILLGSGVGAITPLGVAANGQIPIGSAAADPTLATITGTTDHISVANGAGSITLDLGTNTKTLLGSFNGIFLEKLDFTISYSSPTVTGSLEQDGGGDLIQRFSDGYTTLDCTDPVLTIDLTTYVGTDAVPKEVFVYILQSAKTVMAASNSDWPTTEHIKIANLLLKSAATTGSDGGALVNRNWNDFASAANGEGHITHVEKRIRQEPSQWDSGVALTLKDSAGAALTTGNSSTAVEIVTTEGKVYQLHRHTFPVFDMYTVGTDDAHIVNQPTNSGGAYKTTADLVGDITRYVDGTADGLAIGNNKYFNLVLWGVQNRSGEPSHIMINLPTSQYTNEANATLDVDGTSVFDIPALFKGIGFLIARLTFKLSTSGPEWTYIAQEDLRGQIPPISAGVSVTTTDHALLANLTFALAGHTGFQAQGDVLDDFNTLTAPTFDGQFIVATGAGAFAYEATTTVRTSLGLGTGDSPQFTGIELGHASDTTLTRVSAGVVAIEGTSIAMVGGAHHDGFSDFVGNEHIDHTGVTLTAGTGLTGGGDISSSRSFAVDGVLEDLDTLGPNSADSEFLVGTGAGAFAWESGSTVLDSLALGTGDAPTFDKLSLVNNSIDTAADYRCIANFHTKTAGATDENDDYMGMYNATTYNQSGGVISSFRGVYNILIHTDGDVGTNVVDRSIEGNYSFCDLNGGKVYGPVRAGYFRIDQEAAHEIVGNLYALEVLMDVDGTVSGATTLLRIRGLSGVDYGIYQLGGTQNYFGSSVGIGIETPDATLQVVGDCNIGQDGTNYISIGTTGDMSFTGSAGFYPRRVAQAGIPGAGTGATQIDTGELMMWRDTDDGKVYLVYNDTTSGIKSIELI